MFLLSSSVYSLLNEFDSVLFLHVVSLYAVMCVNFIVGNLIIVAWPWPLCFLLDKFIYSVLLSLEYTLQYVTIWQVRKWFTRKLLLKRAKGSILHAIIITHILLLLSISTIVLTASTLTVWLIWKHVLALSSWCI